MRRKEISRSYQEVGQRETFGVCVNYLKTAVCWLTSQHVKGSLTAQLSRHHVTGQLTAEGGGGGRLSATGNESKVDIIKLKLRLCLWFTRTLLNDTVWRCWCWWWWGRWLAVSRLWRRRRHGVRGTGQQHLARWLSDIISRLTAPRVHILRV